jgi:hypothetical protein
LRLFAFKCEFLNICIDLETALAAEAHPTEERWLEEQFNVVRLPAFRAGT